MFDICGNNVGLTWIKYLACVLDHGCWYHDENVRILELEDIVLTIEHDDDNDEILQKYADSHIRKLYMQKMQTTEIVPELNMSYGKRIFEQQGVNQYEWCLNRLRNKPESKAATMALLLPDDPGPRIPCLDVIDFKLRNNALNTKVFFRSQNVMNAYGNLCSLFWLTQRMANDLNVNCGQLTVFISNGHIFEDKIALAKEILSHFPRT